MDGMTDGGTATPGQAPETDAGRDHEERRETLLHALGHTVRVLRDAAHLSQRQLAQRTGLSLRFIAQLETGRGNISVAKLDDVARALGVPLAALFVAPTDGAADLRAEDELVRHEVMRRLGAAPQEAWRHVLNLLRETAPAHAVPTTVIALLGLRGAGKSTVGPALARALGRRFLELDEVIRESTGLAIPEIFELHGESYYREAERNALQRLIDAGEPVVVSVSGGIVTDPYAMEVLRRQTLSVWLKATPEQHMERVRSQGDQRPMENRPDAMAELKNLLQQRTPLYEQARIVVDTATATPDASVQRIVSEVGRLEGTEA